MSPIALGLRGLGVGSPDKAYRFLPGGVAFTPSMAKRTGAVFAGAPIVQGDWPNFNTPDLLTFARGAQFGNPTGYTYANFDPVQGTIVLWLTPEWDGNDGLEHYILSLSNSFYLRKTSANTLSASIVGQTFTGPSTAGWTAGTTYCLAFAWDLKNTLDGTNYGRWSANDVHTFAGTTAPTLAAPNAECYIGANLSLSNYGASAIIQGLTIYRRVLYDGTYGTPFTFNASGRVDELAAIYAAGVGADPCLVTGSWDVCFCLPTNATPGALATGTGEAWSHPHTSDVLDHWTLEDAFYGGGQWAVGFNGTSTYINCGSGASLDDLPSGAILTIDGWIRCEKTAESLIISKVNWLDTGWILYINNVGGVNLSVQLGTTDAGASWIGNCRDGKWHHIVGYYNDATKTARVAVDGTWGAAGVGAGAYISDAAYNLYIGQGSSGGIWRHKGAIGWLRLSNNDRFTAGTDFIPPREFPGADGNTIEAWSLNDGTGNTVVAQVTSPGNDGAISNGTWEQQWDDVLTPVYPTVLEFDGAATILNGTSGANIDDLPSGANGFTAEGWFRHDSAGESNTGTFWTKTGWYMQMASASTVRVFIDYDTTDINETFSWKPDGRWHHWLLTYNENGADRFARVYRDGVLVHTTAASVGNYVADAASTFYIGNNAGATATMDGAIGWQELSDNVRESDTFVPASRVTPRANDANMHLRYAMTDGAGTSVADTSGNGYTGTITMGSGRWYNWPDMETTAQGHRIYNWGYCVGSDGAGDGIHQHQAGLSAGQNYVVNCRLRYEADKRARPQIVAYDETNGAAISTFRAPFLTGTHDGGNNLATLSDSTAPYWPYSLVGGTVYNITDGSSATITACGTSITAVLAGGTDNDWDNGDVYFIVPPARWVFAEPFCFELPTIARNGAAADCTAISLRLLNQAGEGVVYWEQIELLENLVDNPSVETGAGNPWIPDGWVNTGLDPGDSQASSTGGAIIHSGSDCIQMNVGAANDELVYFITAGGTIGKFLTFGGWFHTNGRFASQATREVVQATTASAWNALQTMGAAWQHADAVVRKVASNASVFVIYGVTAQYYADDAYMFQLNDVSLTVTPASKAGSAEASGLRVDGRDGCTDAITGWSPVSGAAVWSWTPRHDAADLVKFDEAGDEAYLLEAEFDANNRIGVYASAANTITLEVVVGGVPTTNTWNCAGALVAGTSYPMRLEYNHLSAKLYVGGVLRVTVTPGAGINFGASTPNLMNWGSDYTGAKQGDATFAP